MGLLFDAGTIAEFVRISESEMPDTVAITTYAIAEGELGGRIKGAADVVVTMGRVQRKGDALLLSLPLGVEVEETSEIAVESPRTGFSGTYVVESLDLHSFSVHQQFEITPKGAA